MTLNPSANPPSCFPEDMFQLLPNNLSDEENVWWVAKTRSRQEKALAWTLFNQNIPYYLPLIHRLQKSKKRMRVSVVPLFSGYLFFRGNIASRLAVLRTRRVAQIIEVPGQARLTSELQMIKQMLDREKQVELCDFLTAGQQVTITHGPLSGLSGSVIKQKNRFYLQLAVECIGQGVRVEVPMEYVKPEDSSPVLMAA